MTIRKAKFFVALAVLLSLLALTPKPALAASFYVNSTEDTDDGVCNITEDCTLREAINATNAQPGKDKIKFLIPGAVLHTIHLTSNLPALTDPVVIDGYSQEGASPNTVPNGTNAVLRIALDGGKKVNAALWLHSGTTVKGLAVYSAQFNGIYITGDDNVVQGNFIGLTPSGSAKGNSGHGIFVSPGKNNLIGGTMLETRNVISDNGESGIFIKGIGAKGNHVQGNLIGTDITGTKALGNGAFGVALNGAAGTMIGGTAPGSGNVISGNQGHGVWMKGTESTVAGNLIGTNEAGTGCVGNLVEGVKLRGHHHVIGGTVPLARNIIACNGGSGVLIDGDNSHSNEVQGNWIGTNAQGMDGMGNGIAGVGILKTASSNTIGGVHPEARNVIASNAYGIWIEGDWNRVWRNFVGKAPNGDGDLGNLYGGIRIVNASNNMIGSIVGGRNVVAFNDGPGVSVQSGAGNIIRGNSIFQNDLGIDLGENGVTENDRTDLDNGANGFQNFPNLKKASSDGTTLVVNGALRSLANQNFDVDIFLSGSCSPTGFGEGKTLLYSKQVTTDAAGSAAFMVTITKLVPIGKAITATATDSTGNTSEFSKCIAVSAK